MTKTRHNLALWIAASLALAAPSDLRGQDVDEAKALKVKAAYLYQFAKFVEWPAESFESDEAPLVIGVIGQDPFGGVLDRTVEAKQIGGRPIEIQRFAGGREDAGALEQCHGAFICESERRRPYYIHSVLNERSILLVSDIPGFARDGGMIGLVLEEGRIAFEINRESLENAGLKVSSKLLKLARLVQPQEDGTQESWRPAPRP